MTILAKLQLGVFERILTPLVISDNLSSTHSQLSQQDKELLDRFKMLSLSRMQAYGLVSTTIFVSTVINAFRQRSNFYAAAVYLSKSNACMMVSSPCALFSPSESVTSFVQRVTDNRPSQILWNQAIYQTVLFGKLLQIIFFGELRLIEVEVSFSLSQHPTCSAQEALDG